MFENYVLTKHWFIAHLIEKFTNKKTFGLDIGIGKNNWEEFKKCQMISVDINRNSKADLLVDLEGALPFRDNLFDVVIAINSMNYIRNSKNMVDEINRVMKNDGYLICVVDNPNSNNAPEHVWNQSYLNRLLQVSGFKNILQKHLKEFLYAVWYNRTSVYAFAVVKKEELQIKEIKEKTKPQKTEIKWARSYNIKTTHPDS